MSPSYLGSMPLPVHRRYDVNLPVLPVIAEAEAFVEKLARYRRLPRIDGPGRDAVDGPYLGRKGTFRLGAADAGSPVGLASIRSRPVKRSRTSVAPNTR
ncbi:MAG: hypothetical protein LC808_07870 [Actinobacteria bacterium]|nr:hypothetical protein [Actinomycetota bacterium]